MTGRGFLFWMSVSAGLVGFSLLLFPGLNWVVQLLSFIILSLLSSVSWWLFLKYYSEKLIKPLRSRRAECYIGQVFVLDKPIVKGVGNITIDGSEWRVHCQDLPAGAEIKIIGVDGVVLLAEVKTSQEPV